MEPLEPLSAKPSLDHPMRIQNSRSASVDNYIQHKAQCKCTYESQNILKRNYLSLFRKKTVEKSCIRARRWLKTAPHNANQAYTQLLAAPDAPDADAWHHQIKLDLARTFPGIEYFSEGFPGYISLQRVLTAYMRYDTQLGYVQGMNFIVGAILWHATEVDAFWIFVRMMEDYELRDNYLPKLPGLDKHCQIIDLLIFENLANLYRHFSEHLIEVKMFATEWCFTLFGSMVPVQHMGHFIDMFLSNGWMSLYKVALVILRRLESVLLEKEDIGEILCILKPS